MLNPPTYLRAGFLDLECLTNPKSALGCLATFASDLKLACRCLGCELRALRLTTWCQVVLKTGLDEYWPLMGGAAVTLNFAVCFAPCASRFGMNQFQIPLLLFLKIVLVTDVVPVIVIVSA